MNMQHGGLAVVERSETTVDRIRQFVRLGDALAVRAAAFQEVVNSFAGISFDIARDKHLVALFLRAGREFVSLNEDERTQYALMLLSFLRRAENVLIQSNSRTLCGDWSGIRESIKEILKSPGARTC